MFFSEDDGIYMLSPPGVLDEMYNNQYVFVGLRGPCEQPTPELTNEMNVFRDNVQRAVEYAIAAE